jgi:hypothetical protein
MSLAHLAGIIVAGTVTVTDATGAVVPAPGARVTLACPASPAPRVEISDDSGTFRFVDVAPDECSLTTDLQGFAPATEHVAVTVRDATTIDLHLKTVPVRVGVDVLGPAPKPAPPSSTARAACVKTCSR